MAINIRFDGETIDEHAIMSLSQSGTLFDSSFKLGATLCRQVALKVNSSYISNKNPSKVQIYDGTTLKFTLQVDSVSEEDKNSYSYTLVDSMINLNAELDEIFEWDTSKSYTVQTIVNNICDYISSDRVTVDYIGDLAISWDWTTSARDFISYIAEINGSYARISPKGNLEFINHKNATKHGLNINYCADIEIGEYHKIDRVGYEQGTASIFYPNEEVENNTVYINDENTLITDSGNYTREDIIKHIYECINGFEFYSMKIERCKVAQDAIAGDIIEINYGNEGLANDIGETFLTASGVEISVSQLTKGIPFIAQIDWGFNTEWNGGFECQIDTAKQEETSVDTLTQKTKAINIKVDREVNKITQSVEDLEVNIKEISANDVDNVLIQYAQIQGELQPTSWGEEVTWNDEYKTYYRGKITYVDTSEFYSESFELTKTTGKTVSSIVGLYQCVDGNSIPTVPTSAITEESSEIYNEWTKNCPKYNNEYPTYFICIQINYTDGSYSWSDVQKIVSQSSIQALSSRVKTVESSVSSVEQTASEISLKVTNITDTEIPNLDTRTQILETCVSVQADGLRISQGSEGAYTLLTDDGMEIYSEGNKVAYAKKDGFYAIDYIMNGWHMVTANNKNSFCIVRKDYD